MWDGFLTPLPFDPSLENITLTGHASANQK
jgi:hypothetical protein